MAQVARNMTDSYDGVVKGRRFFVCDHDPLYTKEFRQILTDSEVEVIQNRVGCPQQNGDAESFVSAIKRECIERMIFFSEKSLRRAVGQYIEHFHHDRNGSKVEGLAPSKGFQS